MSTVQALFIFGESAVIGGIIFNAMPLVTMGGVSLTLCLILIWRAKET